MCGDSATCFYTTVFIPHPYYVLFIQESGFDYISSVMDALPCSSLDRGR